MKLSHIVSSNSPVTLLIGASGWEFIAQIKNGTFSDRTFENRKPQDENNDIDYLNEKIVENNTSNVDWFPVSYEKQQAMILRALRCFEVAKKDNASQEAIELAEYMDVKVQPIFNGGDVEVSFNSYLKTSAGKIKITVFSGILGKDTVTYFNISEYAEPVVGIELYNVVLEQGMRRKNTEIVEKYICKKRSCTGHPSYPPCSSPCMG